MLDVQFPLHRTFAALPLEKKAKCQFQALQKELEPFSDILRFQDPQSPHLTLQYWQEVMEIEYHSIVKQLQDIAAKTERFTMQCTGAEIFGHRGQDNVLFLNVAFSEELARVKKLCPWPSGKPFAPHITLARIGHPQRFAVHKKKILKAVSDVVFDIPVSCIRLYAEIDGKKQTPIADFRFP